MNGILTILFLIWIFVRISKNFKKVTKNASTSAGAQKKPLITLYTGSQSERQAQNMPPEPLKTAEEALHQASEALFDACGVLDESDQAPGEMQEGESRQCSHGTVGGSMESADHQGMGEDFVHARQQVETRVEPTLETTVKPQVHVTGSHAPAQDAGESANGAPIPALTAEQMRQAVVMAEILKRPAEGRRWRLR